MCIIEAGCPVFALVPQRGDMFIAMGHANILKPQRGDMCIIDGCFQFLAPAGRHVYSNGTRKYPKAPEGRHVLA